MTEEKSEEPIEILRRKLRFRSWHRGTREMDLVMGRFADDWLPLCDEGALNDYAKLLECADVDLYNWLTGREVAPEAEQGAALTALIKAYAPKEIVEE